MLIFTNFQYETKNLLVVEGESCNGVKLMTGTKVLLIVMPWEPSEVLMLFKSGFDVGDLSEDAPDDLEGLDASAAHVANLLSTEPADSMFFYSIFIVGWF